MTRLIDMTDEDLRRILREELARLAPAETPSDVMSAEQVAELLGVHSRTIPKMVASQGLPALKRLGKLWRFSRKDVLKWMSER